MPTFCSLTKRVKVGDYYAWIAEHALSDIGERTMPKEVTDIE